MAAPFQRFVTPWERVDPILSDREPLDGGELAASLLVPAQVAGLVYLAFKGILGHAAHELWANGSMLLSLWPATIAMGWFVIAPWFSACALANRLMADRKRRSLCERLDAERWHYGVDEIDPTVFVSLTHTDPAAIWFNDRLVVALYRRGLRPFSYDGFAWPRYEGRRVDTERASHTVHDPVPNPDIVARALVVVDLRGTSRGASAELEVSRAMQRGIPIVTVDLDSKRLPLEAADDDSVPQVDDTANQVARIIRQALGDDPHAATARRSLAPP